MNQWLRPIELFWWKTKVAFFSWKMISRKLFSKLSYVCLLLEKLVNEKHFPVKGKFNLVSRKVFSVYFGRKTLSGSCEKFRNVILFVDYIKFGPQTFDCYIYFVLNIYFSISSLRIYFFMLILVLIFIIVIWFSLIIF